MIGGVGGDSFWLEKERSMLQKKQERKKPADLAIFIDQVMQQILSCCHTWASSDNGAQRWFSRPLLLFGSASVSKKESNNYKPCPLWHKDPSFFRKKKHKADPPHSTWTAGKALYLQKVPWNLSDVEIKNSYDHMDGEIAQWFGLSFQHQIQGSMTLFFELSIFVFLFSALIFFIQILPLLWHTR